MTQWIPWQQKWRVGGRGFGTGLKRSPAAAGPVVKTPLDPGEPPDTKSFTIWGGDWKFTAQFGQGAPIVTDGYGGWEVVDRPREIGLTEWRGRRPMAIEITFMLDSFDDAYLVSDSDGYGAKIEEMVKNLERLGGIGTGGEPPVCQIRSSGRIPHDRHNWETGRWVVENIIWDKDVEIRNASGNRMRCGGTLTMRQYVVSDALDQLKRKQSTRKSRSKAKKKGETKSRIYIVKSGDTLSGIAAHFYDDGSKWKKIADANNIRDPRNLRVGQHLRIP